MSKWPKILAGICALALAFVVVGTIALRIYLPPEKLRTLVVSEAQKALKREVRLKGISLGIIQGLKISGLEISEAPNFKAGTFAAASSFSLSVRWLPLLHKKVVIDKVELDGLRLEVTQGKDGRFNFSDLSSPAPSGPRKSSGSPAAPAASPVELKVRSAVVSGGRIAYRDLAAGKEWTVSDLRAKVRNFSLDGPFDAQVSLKAEGDVSAKADFSGTVNLAQGDPDRFAVEIRRLEVETGQVKAEASGNVKGMENIRAELKSKVRAAGIELFSAEVSAAVAHGGRPPLAVQASIKARTKSFKTGDIKLAFLPALTVPGVALDTKFALAKDDLRLDTLKIKGEAGELSANGTVAKALSGNPQPRLKASAQLDLPALKSRDFALIPNVPPGIEFPPLKAQTELVLAPDEIGVQNLRLILGKNDLEATGNIRQPRSPQPALNLLFKCRSFSLGELTGISPDTREMGLAGSGFFALAVTGTPAKPVLAGKLQFNGLGATVAGLKLSGFTGTAKFDERRIDVPNLKGNVADGELVMDLTVKDYAKVPSIDLEASLNEFDLGKFLTAKEAMAKKGAEKTKASQPQARTEAAKPATPINVKGKFAMGKLIYPGVAGNDLKLSWDLEGLTPDLKALGGWAKLDVGNGRLQDLGSVATRSKLAKVLLFPFMVIQKMGRIGGIKVFPDFNNIVFDSIVGDYAFSGGLMTLRECRLDGSEAHVSASGTINLPSENLDLVVASQVGHIRSPDVEVKGSFDNPAYKVKVLKLIAEPAKKAAEQLIKNIFK